MGFDEFITKLESIMASHKMENNSEILTIEELKNYAFKKMLLKSNKVKAARNLSKNLFSGK